ncbi:MAG: tetratricopeptide repeat protein, partial [SAR324 cluster bacterium]|nr:tetratricopeptide repeat protein [SAR324 cluster bacterium]
MKTTDQAAQIKWISHHWFFATVLFTWLILTGAVHSEAATQKPAIGFQTNRENPAVELFTKGLHFHKQGKLQEAIKVYKQVIALTPDDATIYNNLGMIHQQLGQLDRALIYYEESLLRHPKYTKALNNKGLVYMAKKNWKKAETTFLQSIAQDINQSESYTNLAILYKRMNRISDSFGMLNQVLAIYPRHAPAFYYLGQNYEAKGLMLQARINYEQFLSFSHNNSLNWIVKKHLQSVHHKKDRPQEDLTAKNIMRTANANQEEVKEYPFDIEIKPLTSEETDPVAANYKIEQEIMNYNVVFTPKTQDQEYTVFLEVVAHVRHDWKTEMLGNTQ